MIIISIKPALGGIFSTINVFRKKPYKTISECVYNSQRFEFVIIATNFPQLQPRDNGLQQLNFALAPISDVLLRSQGFWYSGYTEISRTDESRTVPYQTILRSTILAGRRISGFGVSSGATAVIDQIRQGQTIPIWGLSYFLYNESSLNNLIHRGFYGPCMVTEPTLLGSQPIASDFLGFSSRPDSDDLIRHRYFFGNAPQIAQTYSVSLQAQPAEPSAPQQNILEFHSNMWRLTRSFAASDFFFMIGLTESGQWGLLTIVLGSFYLEAVRKNLYNAVQQGKKDFDPTPPGAGAGASGMTTTTVR